MRLRSRLAFVAIAFVAGAIACSSSSRVVGGPPAPSATEDASTTPDPSDDDDDDEDAGDGAAPADGLPAAKYCETIAGFFCDFYLRCHRILATDATECRSIFLESCTARYQPRYIDLEHAKLLSLSRAGVEACSAHLAKVSCTAQPSDLDGPCSGMWTGKAAAGAPCGIDVESFVCAPGTTCILGLDFCGKCTTVAPHGGSCKPPTMPCAPADACVEGTCVTRALAGEACDTATKPCVTGSTCTDGVCVSAVVVGEGDACDSKHRCPYRAYCDAGICARASLLGEPCTSTRACASGRCDGDKCVELLAAKEACSAPSDCASGQCESEACTPLPSACLR